MYKEAIAVSRKIDLNRLWGCRALVILQYDNLGWVLWNRLGLNYILCTAILFIAALCLPIPLSKWIVRKIKPLRILLFGERR